MHQGLDVKRVGSQHVGGDRVLEVAEQRLCLVYHPHLANPDEGLIGSNPDKRQVPPGRPHDQGCHFCDSHRLASSGNNTDSDSSTSTPYGASSNEPTRETPPMSLRQGAPGSCTS